jgi:superfamily II DNA or RNA helicase
MFVPSYKNKIWDGWIRLFNITNQQIYKGLIPYIYDFADQAQYTVDDKVSTFAPDINLADVVRFFEWLNPHSAGKKIIARDYQIKAVHHALTHKRCLLLSPTSSGKSLVIYALLNYYVQKKTDKKILIVVPTTSLVEQMTSDFADYSTEFDGFDAQRDIHKIYSGKDKITDKKVIITTWQSIYKMRQSYFDQFEAVFLDEAHQGKAECIRGVMEKSVNVKYRFGLTGTLDGTKVHKLVLEGLFGCTKNIISTKQLIDNNQISNLKIDVLQLEYPEPECKPIRKMNYHDEMEFLVTHSRRNKFITDLTTKLNGNTLVLYNYVERHGIPLFELIEKSAQGRKVFLVHGGTDVEDREALRKIVEKEDNAIIVASYGTFSTGINIKRLHNIVFASPSKSVIRVLQSIGRGLRKGIGKEHAKLYDIADNLIGLRKKENYTYKHMLKRCSIYDDEEFDYRILKIKI